MSEYPDAEGETERSYRLERLAGFSVIGAFVFSLALLFVGHWAFWIPFALGLGIGLPGFAILAGLERDREIESGPATADGDEGSNDDDAADEEGPSGDADDESA